LSDDLGAVLSIAKGILSEWTRAVVKAMPLRLPTLRKRVVWHVGNVSAKRRKASTSLEGSGLSVSEHPEEWAEIASLGGHDTHEFRRKDGQPGVFVHMLNMGRAKQSLLDAAAAEGLLQKAQRWEYRWFDDEMDEELYSTFDSEDEAVAEMDDGAGGSVHAVVVNVPTRKLQTEWRKTFAARLDDSLAEDFALLLLLERSGNYDGAWWNETLDPQNLSAPRGVIFQTKLPLWRSSVSAPASFRY